jgi:hypothetical protein
MLWVTFGGLFWLVLGRRVAGSARGFGLWVRLVFRGFWKNGSLWVAWSLCCRAALVLLLVWVEITGILSASVYVCMYVGDVRLGPDHRSIGEAGGGLCVWFCLGGPQKAWDSREEARLFSIGQ